MKILRHTSYDRRTVLFPIPGAPVVEDTLYFGDHFRPVRRAFSALEPPMISQQQSDPVGNHRGGTGNRQRREKRNTIASSHIRWIRRCCGSFGSWGPDASSRSVCRNLFKCIIGKFLLSSLIVSIRLNPSSHTNECVQDIGNNDLNFFVQIDHVRTLANLM